MMHSEHQVPQPHRPRRWGLLRGVVSATLIAAAAPFVAVSVPATSTADAADALRSEVNTARQGCPPLQQDAVLDGVAGRVLAQNEAYQKNTARFLPFADPMPLLDELGYNAGKAKLLQSYGDTEGKAIHGIIVTGFQAIPDCMYTEYGADVFAGDGYVMAAVVLAGA